jgi:iron-sulfur cluster assembly accessory protein
MTSKSIISGEELIGDILSRYPESAQIMEDYGLHCTSCSVNAYEPLKMGAMSHGIDEKVVDEMIAKIDELAQARNKAPHDGLYLTERAARKIQQFAAEEDKTGFGLKLTAKDNDGMEPAYAMDFQEKADDGDEVISMHGVDLFLDEESFKNMQGADIDYLDTQFGSGFKINNPKFMNKGGGGCGSGGCGCGTGKGAGGCGQEGGCGCS